MAAHSRYAELMLELELGLPLWHPEPTSHGETLLGDVGYMRDGAFQRLFHAMLPADDPINAHGVPEGFEVLQLDKTELFHSDDQYLPAGPICSAAVVKQNVSGALGASA